MKKKVLTLVLFVMGLWSVSMFSQVDDEVVALGLPGDNLNLYAVLDVFQKSETIEGFERTINYKDSNINNLDLNNDNLVDYISVVSYNQGHFYSIVLRVAVNSREYQDVAVIEVSKNNAGNVIVQVIGDEALYGKNYVLEPAVRSINETPNPGYIGNRTVIIDDYPRSRVYGNGAIYFADWPIIVHLFSPSFSLYVSPWRWGYYPVYWNPWRPALYYNYWSHHHHHYRNPRYRRTSYIRVPSHHRYYLNRRATSSVVTRNRRSGTYDSTYGGRNYRRPSEPSRVSRGDRRRDNRESTRRRVQPSTQPQNRPSRRQESRPPTRQENRESTRRGVPSRRENRESRRQQVQPAARQQSRPSTRRQVTPPQRQQSRPATRQENRSSRRQGMQPPTSTQNKVRARQQSRPSTRPRVSPTNRQGRPPSARQSNRQLRQSARQSAREIRRSNRAMKQQVSQ